jgi:NDP-sugar pyrophosphorylase family protein
MSEVSKVAVVMAGGLGMRLRPLTEEIPKPLLPLGKRPILEILLETLKENNFTQVIIACGYKGYLIKSYFGDGHNFGVNISYLDEEKRLGTAGPLVKLKGKMDKPFLVINGDIYIKGVKLSDIFNYHLREKALLTLGIRKHNFRLPYGVVEREGLHNRVEGIREKPDLEVEITAGIYILDPLVLEYIPDDFFDMPDLINKVAATKRVIYYSLEGTEWMDIGDMKDYLKVNGWGKES